MPYYAQIDDSGLVIRVVSIAESNALDENGQEDEAIGAEFVRRVVGDGLWIRTSYNGRIRKQYAGPGFTYNSEHDVFIAPSPFPSWVLDDQFDWQAPVPYPTDGRHYYWDEESLSWQLMPQAPAITVTTLD